MLSTKMEIVLLGDSITQGLGSKKINFTESLKQMLNNEHNIYNKALTGTTINYVSQIESDIVVLNPKLVVILYGNVDAQIRPNRKGLIFKMLPKRYRDNGMLMPRPFFSKNKLRRILHLLDDKMRFVFSYIIRNIDGVEQWVDIDSFENEYRRIIEFLKTNNIHILLVSTVFIDENRFKGCNLEYTKYNEVIKRLAKEYHEEYLDIYTPLKKKVETDGWMSCYCYDGFHPNAKGYLFLSRLLADKILGFCK